MEVRNPIVAVVLSVAIHALLAGAIVLYIDFAPGPTVSAELDLSSVELSFAEKEDESAEALPSLPSPAERPKPKEERAPEVKPEKPLPPDPQAYKFPEPVPEPPQLSPPSQPSPPSHPSQPSQPSQPSPPSQLTQARIDAPPKAVRAIRPDYPRGARQRGEEGNVVVEVEIGADGRCADARVVESSGFMELDAAALKAVKAAKFAPAQSSGRPVATVARLKLSFCLK